MGSHSKIEWTNATWNPLRGCTKVSPGCKYCYAETFAERFRGVAGHPYEQGFDLRLVPEKLTAPLRWPTPRMVFVNSMSDLFQDDVPDEYIVTVARVMALAHWHTFQVLTKRAERMRDMLHDRLLFVAHAPNIWWGVSVEDKRYGMPRIAQLRATPVLVRFLSIEPLLEDLGQIDLTGIHWVIVGGESGPGARPIEQAWVESIRDQCVAAQVPFFFKQWGGFPKKKTGRLLNGRTYDEQPAGLFVAVPERARRRALVEAMEHNVAHWRGIAGKSVFRSRSYRRKEMLDVHSDSPLEKEQEQYLFTMPERIMLEPKIGRPQYPIWTEEQEVLDQWWGRTDWDQWWNRPPTDRIEYFTKRFKQEFGYRSVKPWPIYEHQDSGNIMYYMVHATDHPAAPDIMLRAYHAAVKPREPYE